MFGSGLSPGVTCGPIRNTLVVGATTARQQGVQGCGYAYSSCLVGSWAGVSVHRATITAARALPGPARTPSAGTAEASARRLTVRTQAHRRGPGRYRLPCSLPRGCRGATRERPAPRREPRPPLRHGRQSLGTTPPVGAAVRAAAADAPGSRRRRSAPPRSTARPPGRNPVRVRPPTPRRADRQNRPPRRPGSPGTRLSAARRPSSGPPGRPRRAGRPRPAGRPPRASRPAGRP